MKDEITSLRNGHPEVRVAIGKVRPPFTQDIFDERMSPMSQSPQLRSYYGQADSVDAVNHLSAFTNWALWVFRYNHV